MYNCKVKATATPFVNLRDSPNGADIGDVLPNTEFQADTLVNGFLHAVSPITGYISALYVDYSVVSDPVPPVATLPDLQVSVTLGDDVTYARQTIEVTLKPK